MTFKLTALALTLAFSAGTLAESLTKDDYKAGKARIEAELTAAKISCKSLAGNANDICVATAKGQEKIARADLDAGYEPSRKKQYQARVARAEAEYGVARERCDEHAGNAKDVCVKQAKAAETTARADAKAQLKTAEANDSAAATTAEARSKAGAEAAEAGEDARSDKIDAEFGVAKEKCEGYAGEARTHCLDQAKRRFGKG